MIDYLVEDPTAVSDHDRDVYAHAAPGRCDGQRVPGYRQQRRPGQDFNKSIGHTG
ncbi:hypothetical protein [Plantactinospora sp. DSM 117369]